MTNQQPNDIDVVFSFDTTGSMHQLVRQLRRDLKTHINALFDAVPGIRIGVISHGDHANRADPYIIKVEDLSDSPRDVLRFVDRCGDSRGGGPHANYERVLHDARGMSWRANKSKVLVVIGDEVPHDKRFKYNDTNRCYDWENELNLLKDMGVTVYGVHCQTYWRRPAQGQFYDAITHRTGGYKLDLEQFSAITELVLAICYKQESDEALEQFEDQTNRMGRMNREIDAVFATLLGRQQSQTFGDRDLDAVPPGRFQVLDVDQPCSIKDFVEDNGLRFRVGRGFYEFIKTVLVQEQKEVVLQHKVSGDLFCGDKARDMIGLPLGQRGRINPRSAQLSDYTVFIQSTSWNRKLLGHTKFLYETEEYAMGRAA